MTATFGPCPHAELSSGISTTGRSFELGVNSSRASTGPSTRTMLSVRNGLRQPASATNAIGRNRLTLVLSADPVGRVEALRNPPRQERWVAQSLHPPYRDYRDQR